MSPDIVEVQGLRPDDLRDTIRATVREVLRQMFPSSQPQAATLEDTILEEVQRSLAVFEPPQPQPEVMAYTPPLHAELPPLLAHARAQ